MPITSARTSPPSGLLSVCTIDPLIPVGCGSRPPSAPSPKPLLPPPRNSPLIVSFTSVVQLQSEGAWSWVERKVNPPSGSNGVWRTRLLLATIK